MAAGQGSGYDYNTTGAQVQKARRKRGMKESILDTWRWGLLEQKPEEAIKLYDSYLNLPGLTGVGLSGTQDPWMQEVGLLKQRLASEKAATEAIAGPQRRFYEAFMQQRMNAPGRFYSSLIQAGPQRPGISGPRRENISSQNINNLASTLNVPNIRPVMGGD